MAKGDLLSTSEFIAKMGSKPLGSTTDLTMDEAMMLSQGGVDVSNYGNESVEDNPDLLIKEEEESNSWWDNMWSAIHEFSVALGKGFLSTFEGIGDAILTGVSNLMGMAGADNSGLNDFIAIDVSGRAAEFIQNFSFETFNPIKWIGDAIQGETPSTFTAEYWQGLFNFGLSDQEYEEWKEEYTYNKNYLSENAGWFGSAVLDVAQAAGQLVSQVVLTKGFGFLGASTKVAGGLSLGASSVGAGGKGVEQALNEGADIQHASLYGLLTGATEAGTEMIGGVGGNWANGILGKLSLKNPAVKKMTSSLAGKMIAGFLSEGMEEVLSDVADPLWKKITFDYDMNLGEEYSSKDFWSGVAQSFIVGGLVGGVASGVRYYKLSKTQVNGKKIGQQAAIQYSEFADIKSDFDRSTNKVMSEFKNLIDTYDIDIAEDTNIDSAIEQVRNNPDISEKQKAKFDKLVERATKLSQKYVDVQNNLINTLEKKGITSDDFRVEYENAKLEQINEAAKEVKVEAITETLPDNIASTGVDSIIDEGKVIVDTNTTADSDLTMRSAAMVIDNNVMVEDATKLALDESTQKWTAVADERGIAEENKEQFVRENVANDVVKEVVKESGADLKNESHKEIVEEAIKSAASIEEAIATARSTIEVELPDTSGRHNIGGNDLVDIKKQKYSAGWDSISNKFLDDASAVKHFLRRAGINEAQTNDLIRKVRASSGIAKNVVENGFYEVVKGEDGKYKIERTTKGLYNGKDGIIDTMIEYAKANNMDFEQVDALVQEGLSLLDELDRVKDGKTVFGVFYSMNSLTDAQLVTLQEANPEIYKRILKGEQINEAEFDSQVKGTYTGAYLTDEQINSRLDQIRKEVTNFDEIEKELYKINDEVLKARVNAGMLTQAQAQEWKTQKPHYVPEFRVLVGTASTGNNAVRLQTTGLNGAKGSNLVIQDIFLSVEKQIKKVNKFKAMNDLILTLVDNYTTEGVDVIRNTPFITDVETDIEVNRVQIEGETVYGYRNGEQIELRVSPEIAESLHSMDGSLKQIGENSVILKAIRKASTVVRSLMTSWNPFFSWFRNPIKDIQGAVIYTKNGTATLLKNWGRALVQVTSNSELFQIYQTLSGQSVTLKDSYGGTNEKSFYQDIKKSNLSKTIRNISSHFENANEIMEHTTRFAEFLSSFERLQKQGVDYNKAIDVALVDAQEITLNFSRKGIYTKVLNQYIPFLTANIEGAARNIRAFISPKSAKEWASLIIKMLILGIAPQLIQELIYADDEDYQNLADTMKSNYYLIKVGDQFVRVPKGFIQQSFSADIVLATKAVRGEGVRQDDVWQAIQSNWNAIGVDVSGVFFQPIIDAKNNKTWYGGEIVGSQWQSTRPSEQYTKSTSEISKFIGRILNISPLKVDYVLDQMTGILGDILLPLTAQESTSPWDIIKGQFVTDPVYKNKLSTEFYKYKEELTFNKTDGDVVSTVVLSYMTKCANEISSIKDLQKELEDDPNLTQDEKNSQDRLYQGLKNIAYKEAVNNAKKLAKELENYELSEISIDEDKREATRKALGAEEALRLCAPTKVYQKAQCYNKVGVSFDNFYVYYFNMKSLPDKKAVEQYILRTRANAHVKNLLYRLMGFRLTDDRIKELSRWLKSKGLSEEEIALIL